MKSQSVSTYISSVLTLSFEYVCREKQVLRTVPPIEEYYLLRSLVMYLVQIIIISDVEVGNVPYIGNYFKKQFLVNMLKQEQSQCSPKLPILFYNKISMQAVGIVCLSNELLNDTLPDCRSCPNREIQVQLIMQRLSAYSVY